jgi:hypothetical protein
VSLKVFREACPYTNPRNLRLQPSLLVGNTYGLFQVFANSGAIQMVRKVVLSFHNFCKSFMLRCWKAVEKVPASKKKKGLCNGGRITLDGIE